MSVPEKSETLAVENRHQNCSAFLMPAVTLIRLAPAAGGFTARRGKSLAPPAENAVGPCIIYVNEMI